MSASARIARFDPFAGPPRINGARRVGIRPGTELIHPIAVTGERPLRFELVGLPDGIAVDEDGILRGHAPDSAGEHEVRVEPGRERSSRGDGPLPRGGAVQRDQDRRHGSRFPDVARTGQGRRSAPPAGTGRARPPR